jgi:glyoxylase-like metal-dependent hydrolase (beta-lactamase superfamily II)
MISLAAAAKTTTQPASQVAKQHQQPIYRIYPLRNGICKIAGNHAYYGGDSNETYGFALYIWLVLGGDKPILIDAGLSNVEEMNRGAAHVLREPITQNKNESGTAQLRKFGLTPDDIGHVLITHLHFDHVDDLLNYRNAKVYIGKKEWEGATTAAPTWGHGKIMHEFSNTPSCRKRLVLVEDQEVLPGIESFWVGGHTPGSMAYRVNTAHGKAVLTGDTISLLGNFERNIPLGIFSNRDYITFQDTDSEQTSTYFLYVWLIEGGPKPIIVDTGPKYPEEFSRSTAKYIPGGVRQLPEERTIKALKRHGIDPADVSHVIVTHLHPDHYDYFDAFPNARFVVNRREYEETTGQPGGGRNRLAIDVRKALDNRPDALQLVDDEEIVSGVRVFPLGCHSPGSQGILVRTQMGPVVIAGDVVYKYENIEKDRPGRSPDERACRKAMARIRSLADIVLPAHDPLTLERWPDGIIGAYITP